MWLLLLSLTLHVAHTATVHLRGGTVQPGVSLQGDATEHYLLHVQKGVTRQHLERTIKVFGLEEEVRLLGYAHDSAFVARVTAPLGDGFLTRARIDSATVLHANHKCDLSEERSESESESEIEIRNKARQFVVSLALLPDETVGEVVEQVRALDAVTDATVSGSDRLVVTVESDADETLVCHSLGSIPAVSWIESRAQPSLLLLHSAPLVQSRAYYLPSESRPHYPPEATPAWQAGLTGEGVIVGIGDTGLDPDLCFFRDMERDMPFGTFDSSHRKVVSYNALHTVNGQQDDHVSHGSHTAGSVAGDVCSQCTSEKGQWLGDYKGMAPGAKLAVFDFGSARNLRIPDHLLEELYLPATKLGGSSDHSVHIMSNSWGDPDGSYSLMSRDSDHFMHTHDDILLVFACGNSGRSGPSTITFPGNAKNVLSVGAHTNRHYSGVPQAPVARGFSAEATRAAYLSTFSSRGPTLDGRVKPDIVVSGESIRAPKSDGHVNYDSDQCDVSENAHRSHPLVFKRGTSMAAPVAAGAVALLRQWLVQRAKVLPKASLLKALAISSTMPLLGIVDTFGRSQPKVSHFENTLNPPSFEQGFGRMVVENAVPLEFEVRGEKKESNAMEEEHEFTGSLDLWFTQSILLHEGEARHFCFEVLPAEQEEKQVLPFFKTTLVWTDPPAAESAAVLLVNDLDLSVAAPPYRNHSANDDSQRDSQSGSQSDREHARDRTVFVGNDVGDHTGQSEVRHRHRDELNTVEQVWLTTAQLYDPVEQAVRPGLYAVTVSAHRVADGPQLASLVVTGANVRRVSNRRCASITQAATCGTQLQQHEETPTRVFAWCPRACGLHGRCDTHTGRCQCDRDHYGDACEHSTQLLLPQQEHSAVSPLAVAQWHVFRVPRHTVLPTVNATVNATVSATVDDGILSTLSDRGRRNRRLRVRVRKLGSTGDADVFLRMSTAPTLHVFDASDQRCELCPAVAQKKKHVPPGERSAALTLAEVAARPGDLFVGVYGYCCQRVSYQLALVSECKEGDDWHECDALDLPYDSDRDTNGVTDVVTDGVTDGVTDALGDDDKCRIPSQNWGREKPRGFVPPERTPRHTETNMSEPGYPSQDDRSLLWLLPTALLLAAMLGFFSLRMCTRGSPDTSRYLGLDTLPAQHDGGEGAFDSDNTDTDRSEHDSEHERDQLLPARLNEASP